LSQNLLDVQLLHWVAFGALVVLLLVLDLMVFHRRVHTPSLAESAWWSLFWIGIALCFNGLVWWWGWLAHGNSEAGILFLTGFLVEKSLSMDNLFVFVVIFRFFRIPLKYQYRVLFWGVLGAIVLRLAFVLAGVGLIHKFEWLLWIFGAFLIYTAIKLATTTHENVDPENNIVLRLARRLLPVTREDHGERLFARENGVWHITPLFLVLVVVESTDVLFAVDSVPAIIGITRDAFLVFTSNVFAILGLRALYFLLAGVLDRFRYLHYGLSLVLFFVGAKMIAEYWIPTENHRLIPAWLSLSVIAGILAASILASWVAARRETARANHVQEIAETKTM